MALIQTKEGLIEEDRLDISRKEEPAPCGRIVTITYKRKGSTTTIREDVEVHVTEGLSATTEGGFWAKFKDAIKRKL